MIGTLVMLLGGYLGEAGFINSTTGFVIGMLGWFFILYEIFFGEASKISANSAPPSVQSAFSAMKWIVTIIPSDMLLDTWAVEWIQAV